MSVAAIGAIWLRLFLYPKTMKKITYTAWGVTHAAIKVASCSSDGVYINYTHNKKNQQNVHGTNFGRGPLEIGAGRARYTGFVTR